METDERRQRRATDIHAMQADLPARKGSRAKRAAPRPQSATKPAVEGVKHEATTGKNGVFVSVMALVLSRCTGGKVSPRGEGMGLRTRQPGFRRPQPWRIVSSATTTPPWAISAPVIPLGRSDLTASSPRPSARMESSPPPPRPRPVPPWPNTPPLGKPAGRQAARSQTPSWGGGETFNPGSQGDPVLGGLVLQDGQDFVVWGCPLGSGFPHPPEADSNQSTWQPAADEGHRGLDSGRPHTRAAKRAAGNLGLWPYRLFDRPALALATLFPASRCTAHVPRGDGKGGGTRPPPGTGAAYQKRADGMPGHARASGSPERRREQRVCPAGDSGAAGCRVTPGMTPGGVRETLFKKCASHVQGGMGRGTRVPDVEGRGAVRRMSSVRAVMVSSCWVFMAVMVSSCWAFRSAAASPIRRRPTSINPHCSPPMTKATPACTMSRDGRRKSNLLTRQPTPPPARHKEEAGSPNSHTDADPDLFEHFLLTLAPRHRFPVLQVRLSVAPPTGPGHEQKPTANQTKLQGVRHERPECKCTHIPPIASSDNRCENVDGSRHERPAGPAHVKKGGTGQSPCRRLSEPGYTEGLCRSIFRCQCSRR